MSLPDVPTPTVWTAVIAVVICGYKLLRWQLFFKHYDRMAKLEKRDNEPSNALAELPTAVEAFKGKIKVPQRKSAEVKAILPPADDASG